MIKKALSLFLLIIIVISLPSCSFSLKLNADESRETIINDTPTEFGENSLMNFDTRESTKKLVKSFEENNPPVSVYVMYDQMGALPSADSDDPVYIRSVYDALSNITVIKKSDMSITDSYHCVIFTFDDGTSSGFNFEGEGLLCIGNDNYEISGSGPLWNIIKSLTLKDIDDPYMY